MGKLTWVIMVEFAVSALLWLSGTSPVIFADFSNTFLTVAGYQGTNVTANINGSYVPGGLTQVSNGQVPGSNLYFGMFLILFGTGVGSSIVASFIGGSNFATIYLIPAAIVIPLLFILLSPISTICAILLVNPLTFPIGIIIFAFFTIMNMLGLFEWIRGNEL